MPEPPEIQEDEVKGRRCPIYTAAALTGGDKQFHIADDTGDTACDGDHCMWWYFCSGQWVQGLRTEIQLLGPGIPV